jgi:hypothetical protein
MQRRRPHFFKTLRFGKNESNWQEKVMFIEIVPNHDQENKLVGYFQDTQ